MFLTEFKSENMVVESGKMEVEVGEDGMQEKLM